MNLSPRGRRSIAPLGRGMEMLQRMNESIQIWMEIFSIKMFTLTITILNNNNNIIITTTILIIRGDYQEKHIPQTQA